MRKGGSVQGGFILVATLWLMAVLAIIVGTVSVLIDEQISQAAELRSRNKTLLQLNNAEATLKYVLATSPRDVNGVRFGAEQEPDIGGFIRLNDTVYSGPDGVHFAVQDELVLIPLSNPNSGLLRAYLEQKGITRGRIDQFVGRLQDYIDRDEFVSINGAERTDYERDHLQIPTNRFMASPVQLYNLFGWRDLMSPDVMAELVTVLAPRGGGVFNANTMPESVLFAYLQQTPEVAEAIARARPEKVFKNLFELNSEIGRELPVDMFSVSFGSSAFLRLRVWSPGFEASKIVGINITPNGTDAPWRTHYSFWDNNTLYAQDTPAQHVASDILK